MRHWVMATNVLATAWLAAVAGQQPLRLEIVSPADGAFVSDEVTVEARILPADRRGEVTDVTFYVDGKVLCRTKDVQRPKCAWDAGAVIRTHAIRVVAALASGEPLVATSRTQDVDVAEAVDVQVVQVNALVQDRRGNYVTGLTREQFRLTEDGRPQTIVHFGSAESPLEVVVAMDISLSMDAAMPDLRSGVKQFLASLNPVDRVTLVAFNSEPFVLTKREADPAVRERAVNLLRAFGSTSLYDVIIHSIALLSRQAGRRALVVFSDGDDQSSQATFAQVERAIKGSDATVFMVGLGRAREPRLRQTLTSLAAPSGGRTILADRPADLGRAFGEILQELKHQYLLAFSPTTTARDGAWRRLAVETPGLDTRIRAREGYFAPRQ